MTALGSRLAPAAAALAAALALAGCGDSAAPAAAPPPAGPSYAGTAARVAGLQVPVRARGAALELATGRGFAARFWPGVNLGATVPGTFPGELAPGRADYDRWLAGMGELGVRLLRVYTILPPSFYAALASHNRRHAGRPIRLLQGVWIPEEELLATRDAYPLLDEWKAELSRAVAVVHGDAVLPERSGHAAGRYRADVSPWLLGWSLGVEWDPYAVAATDRANAGATPYAGRYIRATSDATPMESWIAAGMDHVATLEARRGWSRPITFTNWLTTDPLEHPSEPLEHEDLVSVDPMHVRATRAWPGGVFASYHAYPYYPDFLRWEYGRARAADGSRDPYAGYLRDLRAHHRGMPVMITEFGVPSSLGSAHRGPLGRDQGGHSERKAGEIDAAVLRRIREEGYAGGVLFAWTDEWFKHTWNTLDLELPEERRALWRNVLTNEEHFGVVAVEAGTKPVRVLDGRDADWRRETTQAIAESRGPVAEVRASHDEAYLWLRIRLAEEGAWEDAPVRVGLAVHGDGNGGLPGAAGADPAADHGVVVGPGRSATLQKAAWLDPLPWLYGIHHGYVRFDDATMTPGSGRWVKPRQILNRPLDVPGMGPQPAEFADSSALRWGSGDPASEAFDQRALVAGDGKVLELRLPWGLLGFADPSSHLALRGKAGGGMEAVRTGRVGISVQVGDEPPLRTVGYDWDLWSRATWHERRKAGWPVLRDAFARAAAAGPARPRRSR